MKYIPLIMSLSVLPAGILAAGDPPVAPAVSDINQTEQSVETGTATSPGVTENPTEQPVTPPAIDDRFYKSRPNHSQGNEQSAHCQQLQQRIDELRGKPQRRHAAVQRYQLECQSRPRSYQQHPGFGGPLY